MTSFGINRAEHLRHAFGRPIAHRGLFSNPSVPENSLGAFFAARDQGFGIECDVRLSADGVLYAFHDDELDRLCGRAGWFQDLHSSGVDDLRLMNSSERPPRVKDMLSGIGGKVPLVIELKTFSKRGWDAAFATERALVEELKRYAGPVVVKSFNPKSVLWMLAELPEIPCGLIACDLLKDIDFPFCGEDEARQLTELTHPAALQCDFVSYSVHDLTPALSRHISRPLMVWTVRTPADLLKAQEWADAPVFEQGVASLLHSGISFRAGTMRW